MSEAEEARVKSEERLTLALEACGGIGTWDWDVRADRVYCDASFAELFGLDPKTASSTGLPLHDFTKAIHPQDLAGVVQSIQDSVETGREYSAEFRVMQADDSVRWVLARGRCHRDALGHATRFPGVVLDITERKRVDEALVESEAQFRTLAESIANLAWMAHADGSIFWYNQRWYDYTGKTFEEMQGWGWQSVHDPAVLPEVMEKWTDAIGSGQSFDMVFPLRAGDGAFRFFLTRVEPVRDTHGRVARWFGTNTDITAQRMTEEELRRKNRELEEFAYVASHDLQEPLRIVNIYTQLMLRHSGDKDKTLEQYAGFVQEGVARMQVLLRDLLTFSCSVHSDEELPGVAVLSESFAEAQSVLKSRIEESGATVIVQPLPDVRGTTAQLTHVFQNLLANSLKYSKPGVPPVIEISAQRRGKIYVVSVKDNGIGFDPQYAERIFGLFKRLHKNEYEGTGLGLAICKRIVERYGGEMWAEGAPGEGSVFYFSLADAGG